MKNLPFIVYDRKNSNLIIVLVNINSNHLDYKDSLTNLEFEEVTS